MKVTEERKIIPFKELKAGDFFLWNGIYLMKVDDVDNIEGVSLLTGAIYYLHENSPVQLVNAEIIIKP